MKGVRLYGVRILMAVAMVLMFFPSTSHAADTVHAVHFYYQDPAAAIVNVAGQFNNWCQGSGKPVDDQKDRMRRDANGLWHLTIDLPAGEHEYKFIVNGRTWVNDPHRRRQNSGHFNSLVKVPDEADVSAFGENSKSSTSYPIKFYLSAPNARDVKVAGSFNEWQGQGMTKGEDGIWRLTMDLEQGEYEFKYFVDDKNWLNDPVRKRSAGAFNNSILVVPEASEPTDREIAAKAAVVAHGKYLVHFYHNDPTAKTVNVAGSFNNWGDIAEGKPFTGVVGAMTRDTEGLWHFSIELAPGDYEYKFVVDQKKWVNDVYRKKNDEDPTGNKNSRVKVPEEAEVSIQAGSAAVPVDFYYRAPAAKLVNVAGEFNSWGGQANGLPLDVSINAMTKDTVGMWHAVIDLLPGQYEYKFVIDGRLWILDPYRRKNSRAQNGEYNSIVKVPEEAILALKEEELGTVEGKISLEGDYVPIGVHVFLTKSGLGVIDETVTDDKGAYQFRGVPEGNYYILVLHPGYEYSMKNMEWISVGRGSKVSYNRYLKYRDLPKKIISISVVGTFNGWSPGLNAMSDHDGDGVWETKVHLKAGRYEYKFVVNGMEFFFEDRNAGQFTYNGINGMNSVINLASEGFTLFRFNTNDPHWTRIDAESDNGSMMMYIQGIYRK